MSSNGNSAWHGRKFKGRDSFPIPVWNGLLEHRKTIGPAIWEFLWCLDRITNESDGVGVVLGGCPVKLEQIADDLKESTDTAKRNLEKLSKKYIKRRRTPYGYVIHVMNSLKFGIWSKTKRQGKNALSGAERQGKNAPRDRAKMPSAKKTQQYYAAEEDCSQQSDSGLRSSPASPSLKEKKQRKLEERIARKLIDERETLGEFLDKRERHNGRRYPDWWSDVEGACGALGYQLNENAPTVSVGFADALGQIWGNHHEDDLLPGILATKVIDFCRENNILWPPDFQEHRDHVRAQERAVADLSEEKLAAGADGESTDTLADYKKENRSSWRYFRPKFRKAFRAIGYPFDESDPVLGRPFCLFVWQVHEQAKHENPQPPLSELYTRVIERCREGNLFDGIKCHPWPRTFEQRRNRLRSQERATGDRECAEAEMKQAEMAGRST